MKNAKEHLDHLRSKPEHIRQRIAIGATTATTGLVAIVWVVTLAANGSFSLQPTASALAASSNPNTNAATVAAPDAAPQTGFDQLLGAVGVADQPDASSTPSLTIVNDGASSTLTSATVPSDATVIPF